jgi:O-antigen ligase
LVLIGSEVSGDLGRGSAPLGNLRLIDTTFAVTLLALAASALAVEAGKGPVLAGLRARVRAAVRREAFRRAPGAAMLAAAVVWAFVMWAAHGHHADGFVRTDLRVLALGVGTWIVTFACRNPPPHEFAWVMALLALPVAAKALAIHASDLFVIGANDRLQASIVGSAEGHRIILLGGDTFLVLAPAVALVALVRVRNDIVRALIVASALAALGGLLISATRTGLLIAVLLILGLGVVAFVRKRGAAVSRLTVAVAVACLALVAGGAWATGFVDRITQHDAPHSGLNFRVDEVRTFLHLPARNVLFGQGFGGRFETRSALNEPAVSGWSHVLPIWIGLKVGLLGLLAALAMLVILARRALRWLNLGGPPAREAALGVVVVTGMLLMSLTIDRATLPEGVPLLAFGLALLPERPH